MTFALSVAIGVTFTVAILLYVAICLYVLRLIFTPFTRALRGSILRLRERKPR